MAIKAGGPASEQLETFLINFVVEQTGYPPEVVELDADLEADLGIDSIKKRSCLANWPSTSTCKPPRDDARRVPDAAACLELLAGDADEGRRAAPAAPTSTPAAGAPASPVSAMANGSAAHTAVSAPSASPAVAIKAGGPASEQLETFLINFVVEQTGYPPEVVELDADLEADLGIDSIKRRLLESWPSTSTCKPPKG